MAGGLNKPPDASIHVQNLKNGSKNFQPTHGDPWLPKVSPNPVAGIYIYIYAYTYAYVNAYIYIYIPNFV